MFHSVKYDTIEGKFSVLIEELIAYDKPVFEKAFSRFSKINNESIYNVIDIGEDGFLTKNRKDFIVKLILSRVSLINEFLLKGDVKGG